MDKAYWNEIGSGYNEEIFDAYKEDRTGKLKRYIRKYADKKKTCLDVGCGTGKAFPYLSPAFGEILGIDISSELLKIANESPFENISLKRVDLSKPVKLPKSDFAFCCNVAILPDHKKNIGIINNVARALKRGGDAIFVIPSVESSLFAGKQIIRQFEKEGVSYGKIPKDELAYYDGGKKGILFGLIHIAGVPTKHYLEPEIREVFRDSGFEVKKVDKLEYNWTSEFSSPPKGLKDPYPWDWLVDLRKK
jgi:SAM-dependent methyltransferase